MDRLVIKGHPTRGKEVIEILEMLGGKNKKKYNGENNCIWHYINKRSEISVFTHVVDLDECIFFTLEEFLEKFPYKVGDKVIIKKYKQIFEILSVRWCTEREIIMYQTSNGWYYTDELQPYKEETMEEKRIDIPKGYEFAGVDDNAQQVVFTKIQPECPKTYKECCKVLDIQSDWHLTFELNNPASCDLCVNKEFEYIYKLEAFRKLLICRAAYWKIAGEQMGLGKPWKPDYTDKHKDKYSIWVDHDEIITGGAFNTTQMFLTFPTEEMRDTFKETFDDDIEFCKEFL